MLEAAILVDGLEELMVAVLEASTSVDGLTERIEEEDSEEILAELPVAAFLIDDFEDSMAEDDASVEENLAEALVDEPPKLTGEELAPEGGGTLGLEFEDAVTDEIPPKLVVRFKVDDVDASVEVSFPVSDGDALNENWVVVFW